MTETAIPDKFLPNIRIPADMHQQLVALAKRNDRTIAAEVRRALRELLVREETP